MFTVFRLSDESLLLCYQFVSAPLAPFIHYPYFFLCAFQGVSVPHLPLSFAVVTYPLLCSPVREHSSPGRCHSPSQLTPPSVFSRKWVPLSSSLFFAVLIRSSSALQFVCAPGLCAFFWYPYLSISLHSQVVCTPHFPIFGLLTHPSFFLPESELSYPRISSHLMSSCFPFSALQAVFSKLSSFCATVLLLCLILHFLLLTQFQPPLLVSTDDQTHHQLIGTSIPSVFTIPNIQNSDNPHSRACVPYVCLTVQTNQR
jgi:hypothetical protein